jgi:ABC-type glycerol-3-phosphate transport system substrate-binding protein
MPHRNEIAYFETLLDIEHRALWTGRDNTFLTIHDGMRWQWTLSQKALLSQFDARTTQPARPDIRVQVVEISRERARVTFETSTGAPGTEYIQSPAFFHLRDGNWLHTYPPYAPYTGGVSMPPRSASGPDDVATITFACWVPQSFYDRVNVFHEYYGAPGMRVTSEPGRRRYQAYPGIHVELVDLAAYDLSTSHDQLRDAQTFLAGLADTGVWPWSGEAVAREAVRDLEPLIDADASFDRADFYPHMIAPSGQGDAVRTLPIGAMTRLISFDKEAFDAAGVPYPHPGWTHEDFLRTARLLTSRSGGQTERYGFVDLASSRRELILALIDPPGEDTGLAIPDLTAPDVVQAVQWYVNLALEHGVMPNPNHPPSMVDPTEPWQALNRLVIDGHAAMWSDYLGNWGERSRESRLGLVPFPTGTRQVQYWHSHGVFMSQDLQHPEAAWAWLRFLTYQLPEQHDIPLYQYYIPARQSVAHATRYWSKWDPGVASTLQDTVEDSAVYRWDESLDALSRAIEAAFGGTPLEQALAEAQASLGE